MKSIGTTICAIVLSVCLTGIAAENPATKPADEGSEKSEAAVGVVTGKVLNKDGSAGAKLLVRIFRGSDFDPRSAKRIYKKNLSKGDLQPVAEAISKPDGTFALKQLEPGDYIVVVSDRKASCAAEAKVIVRDATPITVELAMKEVDLKPDKEGGDKPQKN